MSIFRRSEFKFELVTLLYFTSLAMCSEYNNYGDFPTRTKRHGGWNCSASGVGHWGWGVVWKIVWKGG